MRTVGWIGMLTLALPAAAMELGDGRVAPGHTVQVEHRTTLSLQLTADTPAGRRQAPLHKDHHQISVARLESDDVGTQVVQITWSRNTLDDAGPDGTRTRVLPGVGTPFTVTLSSGPPQVLPADAPQEARAIAASGADVFSLLPRVRAMLGHQPVSLGDRFPARPLLAGLVRDAPGTPIVQGWLTLAAVEPCAASTCATVAIAVTLSASGLLRDGTPASMTAELTGSLVIDVPTGRTRRLVVSGPVTLSGTTTRFGTAVPFEGSGTFTSDTTLTERP